MAAADRSTCPICGGPNDCAIARGEERCWCFDEVFPPNLFDRLPPADRGESCVCRACVSAARQGHRD